ncbi:MAG: glucuronate isomerase, partial [Oscillospiraceae bacterium]|nr:glucuronate isomerase [Oscillospiraceae bacterium]
MKAFMDRDFLLETGTAKHLFHDYAEQQPLIDYHCHISPREIYENRRFDNLAEVWLGGRNPDGKCVGDHYKWRLMRSNGVPEEYITGDKPPRERFLKFVQALELAIGNPMYHWCHLELKKFFGYDRPLTPATAGECWDLCNEKLQNDPGLSARGIIENAKVAMIGTTDDPTDSLEWHSRIR